MDESALREAVKPVENFFTSKELSPNTVLAAYLRAASLPASGEAWDIAAAAYRNGLSFAEAVENTRQRLSQPLQSAPRRAADPLEPAPFSGRMDWFPKAFGPGDIDGVGARKLLGTPTLDPTSLLVREMAQNSWDARGSAERIVFSMNLRRLDGADLEVLRTAMFTGEPPNLGLEQLLRRDEIWCLEVADRGTTGLSGTLRNDQKIEPGVDRNFVDLVFNIGAPRDSQLGGGTYGFGKTISYVISSVGTVLIWSRCQEKDGLEHRLIGSAMGEAFNFRGLRYTGRHWWGINLENRVEPVTGLPAEELAAQVFSRKFLGSETGTSFLILDPQLEGDTVEKQAENLREAVLENLWPKLMKNQDQRTRMGIEIYLEGVPLEIPSAETHPRYSGYAACLQAVRQAQEDSSPEGVIPFVTTLQIRSQRPRALLGHLALSRAPCPLGANEPEHSVALMRHRAELVVKYLELRKLDVPGFQWTGVFKPTAEVDDSYALAEPPAHDDWVPAWMTDSVRKRHVNIGLKKIREEVELFLQPAAPEPTADSPQASVAHVGSMLASLVATVPGSAPSTRRAGRGGGGSSGRKRPVIQLVDVIFGESPEPGWGVTVLQLAIEVPGVGSVSVWGEPKIGVDGSSHDDKDFVRVVGWGVSASGPWDPGGLTISGSQESFFCYEHKQDLAIDVRWRTEEA